ncbi:MAG: protein kinase [Proteobacteria bacterium]|nr:protein kinase [Pseudomonadota bacterium]
MAPTPERFELLAELGRGGSGVVYRAFDHERQQTVALKVVRARPGAAHALRREAEALGQLRHPQVVRVLEFGSGPEGLWCAMQLVDGPSMRKSIAARFEHTGPQTTAMTLIDLVDAETQDLPGYHEPTPVLPAAGGRLTAALTLARGLCRALAYLHGQGIVHRDLKPENVLITSDGPVLVDFGLTSRFAAGGREALDALEHTSGTPPYVAPEQIRGELGDARIDIYALGCMLYELVTGRPPFVGKGRAVLRAHLSEPPLPPSERVDGVPPALDALILRMLHKDAAHRVGAALDVDRALARLGAATPPPIEAAAPRPYLYRPRMIGRSKELRQLNGLLSEASLGSSRLAVVRAPAGIGKTRLVLELTRAAKARSMRVCTGSTSGSRLTEPPLGALRGLLEALADAAREAGPEMAAEWLEDRASVLAEFAPELANLPGVALTEVEPLEGRAAAMRVWVYLARTLERWVARRPMLVMLDDLQWADELTLGFLLMWVRSRRSTPLAFVCTSRPDERADRLLGLTEVLRIDLEPLERDGVSALTCDALALSTPPEALVDALSERADGNAFLVTEFLRLAVAEEQLTRDGQGRWVLAADLDLPSSIHELVERRLRRLEPAEAELAQAAAVLGKAPSHARLAAVTSLDDHSVSHRVEALVSDGLLEYSPTGEPRFAHEQLRRATLASLPDQSRRSLYRRTAEVLTAEDDPRLYAAVASHYAEAGDLAQAALAAERAGRAALTRGVEDEGVANLERALEWGASVSVGIDLARALGETGDLPRARAVLESIEDGAAAEPRLHARWWAEKAAVDQYELGTQAALKSSVQAVAMAEQADDDATLGHALRKLAVAHYDLGEHDKAHAILDRADAVLANSDPRLRALVQNNIGLVHLASGRIEEALTHFRTIQRTLDISAPSHVGRLSVNIANCLWRKGDHAGSRRELETALTLYRMSGMRIAEGVALSNLSTLAEEAKDWDYALELLQSALRIHRETNNQRSLAWDLAEYVEVSSQLGQMASEEADEAITLAAQIADPYLTAEIYNGVLSGRRRLGHAASSSEIDTLLEAAEASGRDSCLARVLCEAGQQALHRGDDPAPWLERARAVLPADDAVALEVLQELEAAIAAH